MLETWCLCLTIAVLLCLVSLRFRIAGERANGNEIIALYRRIEALELARVGPQAIPEFDADAAAEQASAIARQLIARYLRMCADDIPDAYQYELAPSAALESAADDIERGNVYDIPPWTSGPGSKLRSLINCRSCSELTEATPDRLCEGCARTCDECGALVGMPCAGGDYPGAITHGCRVRATTQAPVAEASPEQGSTSLIKCDPGDVVSEEHGGRAVPDPPICVRHTHARKSHLTWCDRGIGVRFVFQDVDHALYDALNRGASRICPQCEAAIVAAIKAGVLTADIPRSGDA